MIDYREVNGNLFENVPNDTYLIHACNCRGNWGKGIAAEFAKRFPEAYDQHKKYCGERKIEELINTSQIILPSKVVCLFTSRGFGRQKGTVDEILESTELALTYLFNQKFEDEVIKIYAPRINAGLFAVPWDLTKDIIVAIGNKQERLVEWTTFIH